MNMLIIFMIATIIAVTFFFVEYQTIMWYFNSGQPFVAKIGSVPAGKGEQAVINRLSKLFGKDIHVIQTLGFRTSRSFEFVQPAPLWQKISLMIMGFFSMVIILLSPLALATVIMISIVGP